MSIGLEDQLHLLASDEDVSPEGWIFLRKMGPLCDQAGYVPREFVELVHSDPVELPPQELHVRSSRTNHMHWITTTHAVAQAATHAPTHATTPATFYESSLLSAPEATQSFTHHADHFSPVMPDSPPKGPQKGEGAQVRDGAPLTVKQAVRSLIEFGSPAEVMRRAEANLQSISRRPKASALHLSQQLDHLSRDLAYAIRASETTMTSLDRIASAIDAKKNYVLPV